MGIYFLGLSKRAAVHGADVRNLSLVSRGIEIGLIGCFSCMLLDFEMRDMVAGSL